MIYCILTRKTCVYTDFPDFQIIIQIYGRVYEGRGEPPRLSSKERRHRTHHAEGMAACSLFCDVSVHIYCS